MKILVLGAHGFLGRHVARQFAGAGDSVSGIGHGTWSNSDPSDFGLSVWHASEINLATLTRFAGKPDVIVHCAGSGSVGFSLANPHQDYVRTVSSTAAALEYIRLHSPGTRLIYPSSAAVYGAVRRLPILESDAVAPASPYGSHKLMAELLCRSYAEKFGISIGVARFFSLYGEGLRKQLLWDACTRLDKGDCTFFGTGGESRDWLHVDDAARLVQALVQHASSKCPIVNGGTGKTATVREVVKEVARLLGTKTTPKFNRCVRAGDPPRYRASVAAAAKLSWRPTIGWREGVRRYVRWFRQST